MTFEEYWEQRAKKWNWNAVNVKTNSESVWNDAVGEGLKACSRIATSQQMSMNLAPESTKLDAAYADGWNEAMAKLAVLIMVNPPPVTIITAREANVT